MQFSSNYPPPLDRALSGATTADQSGPGGDGNEGVLHIPQSFRITGISPSDYLVSYTGHTFTYPFAEVQSVYSTVILTLHRIENNSGRPFLFIIEVLDNLCERFKLTTQNICLHGNREVHGYRSKKENLSSIPAWGCLHFT